MPWNETTPTAGAPSRLATFECLRSQIKIASDGQTELADRASAIIRRYLDHLRVSVTAWLRRLSACEVKPGGVQQPHVAYSAGVDGAQRQPHTTRPTKILACYQQCNWHFFISVEATYTSSSFASFPHFRQLLLAQMTFYCRCRSWDFLRLPNTENESNLPLPWDVKKPKGFRLQGTKRAWPADPVLRC